MFSGMKLFATDRVGEFYPVLFIGMNLLSADKLASRSLRNYTSDVGEYWWEQTEGFIP